MSEQTTANSLLVLSNQLEHLAEAAAHAVTQAAAAAGLDADLGLRRARLPVPQK